VRLLGWVCVERRGAPGRLAGLHCQLAMPVRLGHTGTEKGGGEKARLARPGSASS
jgi:hypothetical protein